MDIIYLYIKESPKGLKYLGQTTKNPYSYIGSGVYWKKHIKVHKLIYSDIKTIIVFETTNREELKEKGLYYSKLWDIVESDEWANLCFESGEHSTLGYKQTPETIEKCRINSTGRKFSKETIEKLRKINKGRVKTLRQKESAASVWRGKKLPDYICKALLEANSIKVINKETLEIFNSIKHAADSCDMWQSTLRHHLFWAKEGCEFKYLDEKLNEEAENRKKERFEKQSYRHPKNLPNKSSKFVGVTYDKSRKKWAAKIRIKNKKLYLGRFGTEELAADAYKQALEKYKNENKI